MYYRFLQISGVLVFAILAGACSSSSTVTEQTTVEETPDGTATSSVTRIDGKEVSSVRTDWEEETITAQGSAPVVEKYNDSARNKALARRGAELDAQRRLATKVSEIQITSQTTMEDLQTSDFVQSRIETVLENVRVVSENYNEKTEQYSVRVEMPKVKLISVVEEYAKRN